MNPRGVYTLTYCTGHESHMSERLLINACCVCHPQPPFHQPSSQNLWKTSALAAWKQKCEFFFFSAVCHRWWESLCNANIISHCVGLALQFALCTEQPGCGVIYQYGEKETSLGSHWKGCVVGGSCRLACCDWAPPWLYWFRGASSVAYC